MPGTNQIYVVNTAGTVFLLDGLDPDQTIVGTLGNDTLAGGIGNDSMVSASGNDTMAGGAGDDSYRLDSATLDSVTENVSEGTDTIYSSVTLTLGANIENLTITVATNGINGTGNGENNVLVGGTGNNSLSGLGGTDSVDGGSGVDSLNGGLGADTLTGSAGNDAFYFDSALGGGNVDSITDFTVGSDSFRIENAIFTAVGGAGTLAANAFTVGSAASAATHRIIYDSTNGALYYDADGNGVGAAQQFATLTTGLAMTNSQFTII